MNHSKRSGIILIVIGAAILLHYHGLLQFDKITFRSFGFLLFGLLLFSRSLTVPSRSGMYFGTFLIFLGFYFTAARYGLFELNRTLSVSAIILSLGLSYYIIYLFKTKKLGYILFGNLFVMLGLVISMGHFEIIPSYLIINIFDTYWPVLVIILGLIMVVNAISEKSEDSSTQKQIPIND